LTRETFLPSNFSGRATSYKGAKNPGTTRARTPREAPQGTKIVALETKEHHLRLFHPLLFNFWERDFKIMGYYGHCGDNRKNSGRLSPIAIGGRGRKIFPKRHARKRNATQKEIFR